jgi:hypothetical protein
MGINDASISSNLIKVSEYDQINEFEIKSLKNKFVNSNLIKENHKNIIKCK